MENYKVLESIGQGSFGKVAKVVHIPTGREMVWKVTNYGGMSEKERQQLYNEVKILREIKADYIVRCFDKFVDKENTSIYLVMEHCKGGDLAQMITRHRDNRTLIQEDFIWRIFTQVVLALYECHRRKNKQVILHRDLKPGNIFLDEKNDAKLGDFGFAKTLGGRGSGEDYAQTNLGSPYYMSPEQCNGQDYNEKSDIWSLGVVLYEMSALSPPFMATNQLSLALKIKEGTFKRVPSQFSEELNRVIKWMLQVEPQQRPDVEDLLNLPHVSMRLRERALRRNLQHTKRKEDDVKRQEDKLKAKLHHIEAKERELDERENQVQTLEREVDEIQRELAEKERQKQNLIRSAAQRNPLVNKSHDVKPHSMILQQNLRNELSLDEDILDEDQHLAHKHMTQLNSGNFMKSSLVEHAGDTTAPLPTHQKVNNSCVLQPAKQSSGSKNLMLKSAGSAQDMTPRSQGHDFTEIMGYKNIDISRDVDQSYMLKGSNNTNKKTNSSHNVSKHEDSCVLKDNSSLASQRALAHQSYQLGQQPQLGANQPTTRRSRDNLKASGGLPQQPQQSMHRKGSMGQLVDNASNLVGISTNSSAGALAGYYQSGAPTNRVSSDSLGKEGATAAGQDEYNQHMPGRPQHQQQQYADLYSAAQTGSSQKTGIDSSLIQRANSINSSNANLPSQFQLYGSHGDLDNASAQKVTPSRQLKRANSNSSSQDHYYGVVKRGDPNSTMISNAVNMSVLSGGNLASGNQLQSQVGSGGVLNTSLSGLPSQNHHVYQSTSVSSSKDMSLIKQSLAKNFSKHFQQAQQQNQNAQQSWRDQSPLQGAAALAQTKQLMDQYHGRNLSSHSRSSARGAAIQQSMLEPSLIAPVNQSNTTQNLTAIGLLTRPNAVDETFQSNRQLQHQSLVKRDFDSVNESYANLNPCLESQSSNHYVMQSQQQQQQHHHHQNHQTATSEQIRESNRSPDEPHHHAMAHRRGMVAQSQANMVSASALGLPPRTNASWQQTQNSHLKQSVASAQQLQNTAQAQAQAQAQAASVDEAIEVKRETPLLEQQISPILVKAKQAQIVQDERQQQPQQQKARAGQGGEQQQTSQSQQLHSWRQQREQLQQQRSGQRNDQQHHSTQAQKEQEVAKESNPASFDTFDRDHAAYKQLRSAANSSAQAKASNSGKATPTCSGQEPSGGLYQPKFTKKNIERGQVAASLPSFLQRPMARRMSSHEFKSAAEATNGGAPGGDGYYQMKGPASATVQDVRQSQSSITHQQFIKQSNDTHQEESKASARRAQQHQQQQQQPSYNNAQHYSGTILTTKAKAGSAHASNGNAAQNGTGNSAVQIKGVCKESLETLMRKAEKMNQFHMNATLDERRNSSSCLQGNSTAEQTMSQTASGLKISSQANSQSRQHLMSYSAQKRLSAKQASAETSHRRLGAMSPSAAAAQAVLQRMSQAPPGNGSNNPAQ